MAAALASRRNMFRVCVVKSSLRGILSATIRSRRVSRARQTVPNCPFPTGSSNWNRPIVVRVGSRFWAGAELNGEMLPHVGHEMSWSSVSSPTLNCVWQLWHRRTPMTLVHNLRKDSAESKTDGPNKSGKKPMSGGHPHQSAKSLQQ